LASDVLKGGTFLVLLVDFTPTVMQIPATPSTILIVEDDEVLGQVLGRVLTCDAQTARHVRTANEALQQIRESDARLVLIDAGLRDGTALQLAGTIRAERASLPIILLTTDRPQKPSTLRSREMLVTKSIDLPELRRTVHAALHEGCSADGDWHESVVSDS
jgi:DNA-binding response OmpR family regulator